jgi:hypothetical protein
MAEPKAPKPAGAPAPAEIAGYPAAPAEPTVASTRADTADLARVQLDALLERIVGDDLEWVVYSSTQIPQVGVPPEKWPQRCLAQLSHRGVSAVGPLPEPDSPQWGHAARQLVHACRDVARRSQTVLDLSEPVFVGGAYWKQLDDAGRAGEALAQALRRGGAGGIRPGRRPRGLETLDQLADLLEQAAIAEFSAAISQDERPNFLGGYEAVPRRPGLGLALELRGELAEGASWRPSRPRQERGRAEVARGERLDVLGQELGLVRGDGESDADFRMRIRRFHRPISERLAELSRGIAGDACEARAEGEGRELRCFRPAGHPGACRFGPR